MSSSLNELYRVVGVTKQSVHQSNNRQRTFDAALSVLTVRVDALKKEHPGCGLEKMYYTLIPKTMGRDKFCEIYLSLGYGVKRARNYHRTTFKGKTHYPNMIEGMAVHRPFQVIQSDITYFRLGEKFYYLVFIIDVYTRRIVGYTVSKNMLAQANIQALNQALRQAPQAPRHIIHHSDRGTQYSSNFYTKALNNNQIDISMGKEAMDNAFVERVNGIIKNEYLEYWVIKDFQDLKSKVKKAVNHYNNKRKHRAFKMIFTPEEFYQNQLSLGDQERPTVTIYAEGRKTLQGASSPLAGLPGKDLLAHFCPMDLFSNQQSVNFI